MLTIIDELTDQILRSTNATGRVELPGGLVGMAVGHGSRVTKEDDKGDMVASYLFLNPEIVTEGAGPKVAESAPVYDSIAGTVTITRTLSDPPDPRPLADQRAEKQTLAKAEAYRRIVAIIPEWKQRNLTARAAELAMKAASGAALSVGEQAEWDAGLVTWQKVQDIRTASDVLETSIAGMTVAALAALDHTDGKHWPVP